VGSDPLRAGAWLALAAVSIATPPIFHQVKPAPPVPDAVARLYVPGKINVVEFADFECPFCRLLHPTLRKVIGEYPDGTVHFVRLNVPLPMHPNAEPASRAYLCAKSQGKGEELADRLVTIELGPETIRRAAVGVGVEPAPFDRCFADPKTAAAVAREGLLFANAGLRGLPTTFVEGESLRGAVEAPALRDAFEQARAGETTAGIPGPLYFGLAAALAAALAWFGRARRATIEDAGQRT
jgi:protein-disulfide isomerase